MLYTLRGKKKESRLLLIPRPVVPRKDLHRLQILVCLNKHMLPQQIQFVLYG